MEQKKKILYIISFLANGGTEKQLLKLVSLLDKNKFEPYVMSLYGSPDGSLKQYDFSVIDLKIKSMLSLDGLKKILSVVKFVRENNIDIVQTFFIDPTIIGFFARILGRVKIFYSCRRDLGFWYTKPKLLILKVINCFTDKIIVNSEAIKNNVVKYEKVNPLKIEVVHNGVDIIAEDEISKFYIDKRRELNIDDNTFIVGIVGNFNRYVKRYDLFVEAAAKVLQKRRNVIFLILGFGNLLEELKEQISSLNIEKHIIFLGAKDNPLPYIATFDIAVNCSDSEGFSNAVLEYMSLKKAIVASDNQGNTELIKDDKNGLLFNCGNADDLSDKILLLLSDKDKRLLLGIEARNTVIAGYSTDKMLRETIKHYL